MGLSLIYMGDFIAVRNLKTENTLSLMTSFAVKMPINDSVSYMKIIAGASFGYFLSIVYERLLQSTGKTIFSMLMQLIGATFNMILDPIMIFGLFGFPKLGFPSFLIQTAGSVVTFFINRILLQITTDAVAVYGICSKLQNFVFMPIYGWSNGMVPVLRHIRFCFSGIRQRILQYYIYNDPAICHSDPMCILHFKMVWTKCCLVVFLFSRIGHLYRHSLFDLDMFKKDKSISIGRLVSFVYQWRHSIIFLESFTLEHMRKISICYMLFSVLYCRSMKA